MESREHTPQREGSGGSLPGRRAADPLAGLDESQLLAATALDGPVRIIAGAGAGKTRTVTRRIAHACASGAWDPGRTLAVTFSVKAAAEMRSRLADLGVEGPVAATFHSAALHQLNRVWAQVSEAPFPHITPDAVDIVARALTRVMPDASAEPMEVRLLRDEINRAKIMLVAPEDYPRLIALMGREVPLGMDPQRFADVYDAYEQEKASRGEIDFDDILLIMCHVLAAFPEAAAEVRRSIGWLTVDEYQDVSPLQHRLMRLWLGGQDEPANRNVCVVGDPAQTIYSFAGASSRYLMGFAEEFGPLAADVDLATDYRSTPQIVGFANRLLAAAPCREDYLSLTSGRAGGTRIERTMFESDDEEAQSVATRIRRAVDQGRDPSDFAVLTRINAQSRPICRALRRVGLPMRVRRDSGWNDAALSVQTTQEGDEASTRLASASGSAVSVSTIHAAKGLEFRHVFLIGCSEGLLPYGAPGPGDDLEEERRLMYVAVTRAEDSLHLSYARSKDGIGPQLRQPSRFII